MIRKIEATTSVIFPVGTPIEVYQDNRPRVGQTFNIRHIDTKKVVQEARVTGVEKSSGNSYLIRAVITKVK